MRPSGYGNPVTDVHFNSQSKKSAPQQIRGMGFARLSALPFANLLGADASGDLFRRMDCLAKLTTAPTLVPRLERFQATRVPTLNVSRQ